MSFSFTIARETNINNYFSFIERHNKEDTTNRKEVTEIRVLALDSRTKIDFLFTCINLVFVSLIKFLSDLS